MKTVRRLYFYAVAFISLEVVLWGLIRLLRSIFNPGQVNDSSQSLAQALALILVGVPIFLVHWLWVQSASKSEDEEKNSSLRAVFLYAALAATLVPVVQNALALLDRLLLYFTGLNIGRAMLGADQSLSDNLIAVAMNLLIAAYFWNILRGAWVSLSDDGNFKNIRRLYLYLWLLYSLLMVVFGSQQVIRYIFYIPTQTIGFIGRETLVNGLALLVIGTPVWLYDWGICQAALRDAEESASLLRLGVLYILALSGVITVLVSAGTILYMVLNRLFGDPIPTADLVQKLGGQLSLLIPFGAVWSYYGGWLWRHIDQDDSPVRRAGKRRIYSYILSAVGLTTTFIGLTTLITLIINLALRNEPIGGPVFQHQLASSIAVLAVGLPLWLVNWFTVQTDVLGATVASDHSRRSVIRKVYLYLAMFSGVIGGMVSAVGLVFELLQALLGDATDIMFLSNVLNNLQILLLFTLVLLYHLLALRSDNITTSSALESRQAAFQVFVFDQGNLFATNLLSTLKKQAPGVQARIIQASGQIPQDIKANAIVLPGSLAINTPASLKTWIEEFKGSRLILPDEVPGITWARDLSHAANNLRALAEGQELQPFASRSASPWIFIIYIFAGLFALELVLFLLALIVPTFID